MVPIDVTGENGTTVYAIATSGATSQLDDLGFEVLRLGSDDLPLATDVYFLRDDRQTRTGFLVEEGESSGFFDREEDSRMVLASSEGGLYVALPADRSVLQYHFEEVVHGHILKLTPGMSLLEPFEVNESGQTANLLASPLAEAALSREEIETFRREITPESVAADVDRYSGRRAIDGAGGVTIKSRHVQHEHNAQAVAALAQDLEGIGGDAFSVGLYQFDEIMRERQSGKSSFRKTLNNVEAELAGNESQETVLVTAHLDSTACDPGPLPCRDYDATNEPAPGADDDGSGIAGVLAAARAINRLSAAKRPKRTVRFVLFNAEEVGLVGSREYAQDQAALGKPIAAVYQMDMMGYNKEAPRTYEIHAGADREAVQDASLVLAQRIEELSKQVSPDLPSPQIHLNKGLAEEDKDPAYRRSDHHSFHLVGYAACAATEDFFPVPLVPGEPVESEGNPNYHTARDTFVDPEYAADIARAVAAAAWVTANL